MDQNPLDPDDRLRGRPPGRTRKVMNVSMALDVYNALMKIPEGQRSAFIADKLRPIAKQFDPGPSSVVVLSLKYLLDSAIAESKNSNDYEKLAAVSSLANEIMPVLNPYLELCKESDSDHPQTHGIAIQDRGSIKDIIESIRTAKVLGRLQVILQNAETIHNAVPQRYRDRNYEKDMEETKTLSLAISSILGKYGDYTAYEEHNETRQEYVAPLASSTAEADFRKGLPMLETVNDCKKVLEDSKDIADAGTRDLVSKACHIVDSSVRRSWGSGIELQMSSYRIHPERGTFLVTLFNRGHYDVSISGIRCDGKQTTFHAEVKSGPSHLPVLEESTVEVFPCVLLSNKTRHTIAFEISFVEFTFELTG